MVWQSGGDGSGKNNGSTSSRFSDVVDVQRISIFGRKSDEETISQLKFLAMDPCRPQFARDNIRPLWNQILRIRKVMVLKDSEAPWRKRKFKQFIKDKLTPPSSGFVSQNEPKRPKLSSARKSSHVSSIPCLLNSDGCQNEKNYFSSRASCSVLTFADDFMDTTLDSDESVKGSNHLSPVPNPNLEASNEDHFIGDHPQKSVIPIGPRFQADVPDWAGMEKSSVLIRQCNSDPDNSKFLGTITWPIQTKNMKATGKRIGKGRLASCSCASSGSVDCVTRHVLEERLVLKCDLGPAFFSWKFDDMGEQVSKVWSLKDQKSFELVVRVRSSDNAKSFLKRVLRSIPGKKGKDVVKYYFNVYIPNRMSMHTRSPSMVRAVDTDDEEETGDEEEDLEDLNSMKKSGESQGSKDLKGKYLRGGFRKEPSGSGRSLVGPKN